MPSGDRDWGVLGGPGTESLGRAGMDRSRSPGPALRPIRIGDDSPGPLSAGLPKEATHPAVLFLQVLPPAARTRLHRRACQDRRPVLLHLPDLCPSGSQSHPHRARRFPSPGQGRAFHAGRPPGAGLCSGLPDIPGTPRPVAGLLDAPRRNGHRPHRSLKGEVPIRRPGLGGRNPAGPPQPAVARRTRNPPVPGFCWLQCPLLPLQSPPAVRGSRQGLQDQRLVQNGIPLIRPCLAQGHPVQTIQHIGHSRQAGERHRIKAEGRHSASGPFGQTPASPAGRILPGSAQVVSCSSARSNSRSA